MSNENCYTSPGLAVRVMESGIFGKVRVNFG